LSHGIPDPGDSKTWKRLIGSNNDWNEINNPCRAEPYAWPG